MRRAAATLAAVAAAALAGCGGDAGEVLSISTSGGGGDNHRYVVTWDGRGSCDGQTERALPSAVVLDAREVERKLKKLAKDRAAFPRGPRGARRYVASTNDGVVTWVEGARGAPPVVAKAIVLSLALKRELCA
jgi:hypothetical protein